MLAACSEGLGSGRGSGLVGVSLMIVELGLAGAVDGGFSTFVGGSVGGKVFSIDCIIVHSVVVSVVSRVYQHLNFRS